MTVSYLWYWPSGGWDFDRWREASSWTPVVTPQSGAAEPVPLVPRGGTLERWKSDRAMWLEAVRAVLGESSDAPPTRFDYDILESHAERDCSRQRVRYTITDDEFGYAWLLTPLAATEPRPCVVALHQTVPQGKDEPIGIEGSAELAYGRELVRRGFVVLAPDAIGFGERRRDHPNARYRSAEAFFAAHPNGSVMAKMNDDISRAVDLLERLPEADARRVGCIGHSHGAYGTLYAMLFEPRLRAGVVSCGVTAFRSDPTPQRWWRMTALIPRLGFYEGDMSRAPFEAHHLLALVAPRPLMVSAALADSIFPNTDNIPRLMRLARRVYTLYGVPQNLRGWVFHGAHDFPRASRTRAYAFLERALSDDAS
jgi:dienelactone hydrolase